MSTAKLCDSVFPPPNKSNERIQFAIAGLQFYTYLLEKPSEEAFTKFQYLPEKDIYYRKFIDWDIFFNDKESKLYFSQTQKSVGSSVTKIILGEQAHLGQLVTDYLEPWGILTAWEFTRYHTFHITTRMNFKFTVEVGPDNKYRRLFFRWGGKIIDYNLASTSGHGGEVKNNGNLTLLLAFANFLVYLHCCMQDFSVIPGLSKKSAQKIVEGGIKTFDELALLDRLQIRSTTGIRGRLAMDVAWFAKTVVAYKTRFRAEIDAGEELWALPVIHHLLQTFEIPYPE